MGVVRTHRPFVGLGRRIAVVAARILLVLGILADLVDILADLADLARNLARILHADCKYLGAGEGSFRSATESRLSNIPDKAQCLDFIREVSKRSFKS